RIAILTSVRIVDFPTENIPLLVIFDPAPIVNDGLYESSQVSPFAVRNWAHGAPPFRVSDRALCRQNPCVAILIRRTASRRRNRSGSARRRRGGRHSAHLLSRRGRRRASAMSTAVGGSWSAGH